MRGQQHPCLAYPVIYM